MPNIKRVVSTGFWNDEKVLNDFSPEDKYFMLYLLTNPYTTQLGVYNFPIKHVALDMGYSEDTIRVLLDRFENKYGIIKYSNATSEIAIKNYLKHSIVKGGKPVYDCLVKEEKNVKDKKLLMFVISAITSYDPNIVNKTVLEYISYLNNIYINDNDNERFVHDSYHDSSQDVDFEYFWKKVIEMYPNKSGLSTAKQKWMNYVMSIIGCNREQVANDIISATNLYLEDYRKNHNDGTFKYVPRLDKWIEEDLQYWLSEVEKKETSNEDDPYGWGE